MDGTDPGEPVEVPVVTGNEPSPKQPHDPVRRNYSQGDGYPLELAPGEAVVGTGRISAARQVRPVLPALPFSRSQLANLDDVLVRTTRSARVHFGIYLGDLGPDTRTRAEELHDSLGEWADDAVLVAVSPGQRVVEVVTGCRAANRLPDRGCKLAVENMVSMFKDGDLAGGLSSGLRMLADHTES
jgi:Domain of unknown function (DUF5130)